MDNQNKQKQLPSSSFLEPSRQLRGRMCFLISLTALLIYRVILS